MALVTIINVVTTETASDMMFPTNLLCAQCWNSTYTSQVNTAYEQL